MGFEVLSEEGEEKEKIDSFLLSQVPRPVVVVGEDQPHFVFFIPPPIPTNCLFFTVFSTPAGGESSLIFRQSHPPAATESHEGIVQLLLLLLLDLIYIKKGIFIFETPTKRH
jgi:hypothetical protein